MDSNKICTQCYESKAASEFFKGKVECKTCNSKRTKAYRKTPNGYARKVMSSIKLRSKERGHPFDVTLEDIKTYVEKPCFYCGTTEVPRSLDRIDCNKGYLKDNVNVSCVLCNDIRNNMPYEAWLVVSKYVNKALDAGLLTEYIKTLM